nr:hypothetical protein [Escherichia coli]
MGKGSSKGHTRAKRGQPEIIPDAERDRPISEGPVEGPVDGLKSVLLNSTPVLDRQQ